MSIKVTVDYDKVKLRLERLPPAALDALESEAGDIAAELLGRARGKASGEVLQVRTGRYLGAIQDAVRRTKDGVSGKVFSKDPRAGLFEYGGSTGAHEIAASDAQALVLQVAGGKVFASRVHHPGAHFGSEGGRGKYSAILAAFDEMRGEIFTRLYGAVADAVEAEE